MTRGQMITNVIEFCEKLMKNKNEPKKPGKAQTLKRYIHNQLPKTSTVIMVLQH
jgi:hypothetical protein